jgi:hypothetical protein
MDPGIAIFYETYNLNIGGSLISVRPMIRGAGCVNIMRKLAEVQFIRMVEAAAGRFMHCSPDSRIIKTRYHVNGDAKNPRGIPVLNRYLNIGALRVVLLG